MKILSASVQNFASYKSLEFDFQNQGLTLIQGPTGSGKSTLCDVIPWILFGKTAKGGTVDEVLSWPGDEVTKGTLWLQNVTIQRTRGPKAKDNDLSFWPNDGVVTRGKDIPDTQKLINSLLQVDYDLYLAGAYYHEFSQTAQFFTTTAKNRRTICEQLVDLSLAIRLQARLKEEDKFLVKQTSTLQQSLQALEAKNEFLEQFEEIQDRKRETWQKQQEANIVRTVRSRDEFEVGRKKTISKECKTCGTVLEKPQTVIDDSVNPYLNQLENITAAANPFAGAVKDCSTEIYTNQQIIKEMDAQLAATRSAQNEVFQLLEVTNAYRSVTIETTIKDIERQTNQLLTDHFDGEIRVNFEVADADKLDVMIQKDGNSCSYTQLSKGQRCLLKLCFGVSVMQAVQNHHGVNFDQVFFDEALEGLSEEFKLKALRLLETIGDRYGSVFVVEHSSEFKAAVLNSYTVSLTNGSSTIEKT
jgi:DNA repair exonuclease SbcCD ATPase subunit